MQVALAHDWMVSMRGAEKVLLEMARLFPGAPLYSMVHLKGSCAPEIEQCRIHTSFLSKLPGIGSFYRYTFPLMPFALRQMKVREEIDVMLSTSHCVMKSIQVPRGVKHICYCHTPMRYVWGQSHMYHHNMERTAAAGLRVLSEAIKRWDRDTADRVDHYIANSHYIADRIRYAYDRESDVVYPPVNTEYYCRDSRVAREDFYLIVSAASPYKRLDHAIDACRILGRKLKIVGRGQQLEQLRRQAADLPDVELLGYQTDEQILKLYRSCRALLFPAEEDFGIAPVEAMSCGAPVVAYGVGGCAETVVDLDAHGRTPTGVHYMDQTPAGLVSGIERFEAAMSRFDGVAIAEWAQTFSRESFIRSYLRVLAEQGVTVPSQY